MQDADKGIEREALKAQAIELSESQIELIEGIGACYYHVRKDDQVTIRKIAVLPEYQKQGWGRLLIYRVICKAIEEKKSSVFLKCPSNSIASQFYQKLGFELEATEQGKNQPINHWRYHIKLPLLFYCGGGGKSKYDAIALESGWNLGINSGGKNKAHQHMMMVDNSWKNYNHAQHLEMVRQNKPLIATARDIEHPEQLPEILEQAAELAAFCGRVLLIPKCDVTLPENYWLGYSVESKYGKTDLKPEWFGSRPVHLLGGSPKKQALLYPQMNVVSLDANYAMNLARNCKAVWSDGEKNIEQREQDCYQALGLSLSKQFEFWQNGSFPTPETKPATKKESDKWYTPPNIQDLVTQALGAIDLDPCADDEKHIAAAHHYKWNPAHFGDVPYIADGDQLTIFCQDTHEPPDPDDYPTIPDYEQAWTEWELNNQPKDKNMPFQFSATSVIAQQIAQLQEQLNQAIASLKPYQECEQKAEELRLQMVKYGEEVLSKGIPPSDILSWAKSLYSAVSGQELDLGSAAAIASQNEEIARLKCELASVQNRCEQANVKRDEAIVESEKIGCESVARLTALESKKEELKALLSQYEQLEKKVAIYSQDTQELDSYIAQIKQLEKENHTYQEMYEGQKAQKEQWENDFYKIRKERNQLEKQLKEKLIPEVDPKIESANEPREFMTDDVAVVDADTTFPKTPHPDIVAQAKGREFIASIKSKVGMNNLTWQNISEVCQGNSIILREMGLSATTKLQKDFVNIDNLARLMSEYILETGDITDYSWLGEIFVAKVEVLVETKKSLLYHKGDWVQVVKSGSVWEVRSFDGEWLSVIKDNKITSMHKSEVELIQQEVAA